MKKIISMMFASFVLCAGFLFGGCDDATDEIYASCWHCNDSLQIDIGFDNADAGGYFTNFRTKNSIEKIKSEIEAMALEGVTLKVTQYGTCFLLIEKVTEGTCHYYLVDKHGESDGVGSYTFQVPIGSFSDHLWWIVPYHLIFNDYSEIPENFWSYTVKEKQPYPALYSMDEFYAFYSALTDYQTALEGDKLMVRREENGKTVGMVMTYTESPEGNTVIFAAES